MSVVSCPMKIALIFLNSLIMMAAFALVVIGCMILGGSKLVTAISEEFEDSLNASLSGAGISVDTSTLKLDSFLTPLAYLVIVIGSVAFAFALFGYISACCGIKYLLQIYWAITATVLLIQFIIACLVANNSLDDHSKPFFKDLLQEYTGITGNDPITLAWNGAMALESCCGVDNYKDFEDLPLWPPSSDQKEVFQNGLADSSLDLSGLDMNQSRINLYTPLICCKELTEDIKCALEGTANDENNNMNIGCYDKLYELLFFNDVFISMAIYIMFFEFVILMLITWILVTSKLLPV